MTDWLKRNASTILTCLSTLGLVGTVVLAVQDTPKAMRALTDAKLEKGSAELTKLETVKAAAPAYIPTAAAGTATLVCMFAANVLNRKQQAALVSAYAALERTFQNYREKVALFAGRELDNAAWAATEDEQQDKTDNRPPWNEKQTFYLEGYPGFFERTMEEVRTAEYVLNRNFILRGQATFNEFLTLLGLDRQEKEGDDVGWDNYIGEALYGYRWVDFDHIYRMTDDGMVICEIALPFEPHRLDEDGELKLEDSVPVCGVE